MVQSNSPKRWVAVSSYSYHLTATLSLAVRLQHAQKQHNVESAQQACLGYTS